jgi:hypothetical protein
MSRKQTSRAESRLHVSYGVVRLEHAITYDYNKICTLRFLHKLCIIVGGGANGRIFLLSLHCGPAPWSSWLHTQISKVECKRPFVWKVTAQNIRSLSELHTSQVRARRETNLYLSLIFGRVRIPAGSVKFASQSASTEKFEHRWRSFKVFDTEVFQCSLFAQSNFGQNRATMSRACLKTYKRFCVHLEHNSLNTYVGVLISLWLSKVILFLQNNAAPHKAAITHQKSADFHFQVVKQPANSPDLAPSDYYLFPNLFTKPKTYQPLVSIGARNVSDRSCREKWKKRLILV